MTLASQELVIRVSRIVEDLGGLSTAAVVGFEGDGAAAVKALAGDQRWAFADLRDTKDASALTTVEGRPVIAVAVRAANVPAELAALLDAVLDRRASGKIVVLCDGAAAYARLPTSLQRIPYSDFV